MNRRPGSTAGLIALLIVGALVGALLGEVIRLLFSGGIMEQVFSPLVAGPLAAYFNASHPGDGYRWLMSAALFYFALGTLAISRVREHRLNNVTI